MITKLTHDQVFNYWETTFKDVFLNLAPGHIEVDQRYLNNLLQMILLDRLEVWVVQDAEDKRVQAVFSLTTITDAIAMECYMLIYSLYSFETLHPAVLRDTVEKVKTYAKSKNCNRLVAYTYEEHFAKFAEQLGAKTMNQLFFSL